MEVENIFKVKLVSSVSRRRRVVFDVTPDLAENQNVNYKSVEPIHAPGTFWVYQNTSARAYNLSNVKFISRTIEEATINLERINCLRGWTKPFFGEGTAGISRGTVRSRDKSRTDQENQIEQITRSCFPPGTTAESDRHEFNKFLGSPPEVLLLSAYSSPNEGSRNREPQKPTNIRNIPVVIAQLSIPYPSDVDYIPTEDGTPFPAVMSIDMQLNESHSPREFREFDLYKYRRGILTGF